MTDPRKITTQAGCPLGRAIVEVALVFVVFLMHGAWPTPDVNETNYVIKALHFWNADTYPGDFFLNTADAHAGFYWVFGWLTQWMSLDAATWVGRVAMWLLLAIAWRGLSFAVVPKAWVAVLSAELFVLLNEQAQMAGEWVIGGVEGKGFAYAFVFWALHAMVRGRWNLAWILLGPAVLLHAVVGVWAAVCGGIAWLATPRERPRLKSIVPGIAIGLLLAAPGLWLGIQMNRGDDLATSIEAAQIQVFERLPHHLQPYQFRDGYVQRHALLIALFLLFCTVTVATERDRRFRWFIGGGMLLALVGFGLACWSQYSREIPALLLRLYWFRLADCLVPLGVALVGIQYFISLQAARRVTARWWLAALIALSAYDLASQAHHVPGLSPSLDASIPRSASNLVYADWRDVCNWAAENTPPGMVFITPRISYTFKWYTRRPGVTDSGRGEVINWKEMPQDARRLVEWWQRLNEIFGTGKADPKERWLESLSEAGLDHLQKMSEKYGASYAIVELHPDLPRLALQPVYENDSYAIYELKGKK
ncbi:MAG: hypothetical protein IT427_04035 [Pirellulales bacterium]|nr:hypothetical protein [Pirellulales bacterium]